ncbi:MAG: cell division protein FtsQ/DivIB [Aquificaceae bacterium]
MKERKWGNGLKYLISILWLFSMALAGYFVPYFTDNISFFKIKRLHIEGLETIPPQVISEEIKNLKNNWLFINKIILLKNLNNRTNNAIKDIDIERIFTKNGVELKVKAQERSPLFCVISDNDKFFFDEDGIPFQSPYINVNVLPIYGKGIDIVAKNFNKIKNLIGIVKEETRDIYITELNTIIYLKDGTKLVLPPPFLLDENVLYYLEKVKTYNINMRAKEVEISNRDIIIIRGDRLR